MKLIADAGSTKTKWVYVDEEGKTLNEVHTVGINAMQVTEEELKEILSALQFDGVNAIRFYGAGCVGGEVNEKIKKALSRCATCDDIEVHSDIVGAAVGTLGSKRGIVCILGTGSNSALWNGKEVAEKRNAGGYILGDEGSGAVIGRQLMSDYIKGLTPDWLTEILRDEYKLDYATTVQRVYREAMPNRWLASFAKLLGEHMDEPYVKRLIETQFQGFILRNIAQYAEWQEMDCAFVGSIAFYFQGILREVCKEMGVRVRIIKKEPF